MLRCKESGSSPDTLRENLEIALCALSEQFRAYPTLPADPVNALEHMDEARDDATALLLPRKHCAFKGCAWNGSNDSDVVEHLSPTFTSLDARYRSVQNLKTCTLKIKQCWHCRFTMKALQQQFAVVHLWQVIL